MSERPIKERTFDDLKDYNDKGAAIWKSRELAERLGYTRYEKFKVKLTECMDKWLADGKSLDDHFTLEVKKVGIGSKAIRGVENYYLSRSACVALMDIINQNRREVAEGVEYFKEQKNDDADLNAQIGLTDKERDEIRRRNNDVWKKYNKRLVDRYIKLMEHLDSQKDFRRDDTFHGIHSDHHIMYKLDTLKSIDGKRGYEFLIEFDILEPTVGIYYGVKGIIQPGADADEQREQYDKEWKDVRDHMIEVLNNTFEGKNFANIWRPTDNANNRTYWPFWFALSEDNTVVDVAARATRLIKKIYEARVLNPRLTEDLKDTKSESTGSEKGKNKIQNAEDITIETRFTQKAFDELLRRMEYGNIPTNSKEKNKPTKYSNYNKLNKEFFSLFLELAVKEKRLVRSNEYEMAWEFQEEKREFAELMIALFYLLKNEGRITQRRMPWNYIEKVFLDKDSNMVVNSLRQINMNHAKKYIKNYKPKKYTCKVNYEDEFIKKIREILVNQEKR